jgi:hypothetical protein
MVRVLCGFACFGNDCGGKTFQFFLVGRIWTITFGARLGRRFEKGLCGWLWRKKYKIKFGRDRIVITFALPKR